MKCKSRQTSSCIILTRACLIDNWVDTPAIFSTSLTIAGVCLSGALWRAQTFQHTCESCSLGNYFGRASQHKSNSMSSNGWTRCHDPPPKRLTRTGSEPTLMDTCMNASATGWPEYFKMVVQKFLNDVACTNSRTTLGSTANTCTELSVALGAHPSGDELMLVVCDSDNSP